MFELGYGLEEAGCKTAFFTTVTPRDLRLDLGLGWAGWWGDSGAVRLARKPGVGPTQEVCGDDEVCEMGAKETMILVQIWTSKNFANSGGKLDIFADITLKSS